MNIRPFNPTDEDYAAIVAIDNAIWTDYAITVEEFRHWDKTRDKQFRYHRFVLENEGRMVGYSAFGDRHWAYEPGRYFIDVAVLPEEQRQGFGSTLYRHLLEEIDEVPQPAVSLSSFTQEDKPQAISFLKNRGFEQVMRFPRSMLDVQAFDPTPFAARMERVRSAGIKLQPLEKLMAEDPDWLRHWYDMSNEIMKDVPYHAELTPPTIENVQERLNNHPRFSPGTIIVALDGDDWVGTSGLWLNNGHPHKLETGLTGVLRSHRRIGLATAMKVTTICLAQEMGIEEIETDNEENNPMFQLNLQLGYQPIPANLDFLKTLNGSNH